MSVDSIVLQLSVNGGAQQTGGVTVAIGASVVMSVQSAAGFTAVRYEITDARGLSTPAGWNTDSAGIHYVETTGAAAPAVTASVFAKYISRVRGKRGGDGGYTVSDESTGFETLGPISGLHQIGFRETDQFHDKHWIEPLQDIIQAIETGTTPGAGSTSGDFKESVRAATTANITLSGTQTVDGVALIALNRCLVKDQTTGANNGIYVVSAGAWTRSTDADTSVEVTAGMVIPVSEGSTNGNKLFFLTTDDPIILGTTALIFQVASGGLDTGIIVTPGANQDNYLPGGNAQAWADAAWLYIDPTIDLDITGVAAAVKPKRVLNRGTSDKTVGILNSSGSSTAVNQILTETKNKVMFGPRSTGYMEYDFTASRWRFTKTSTEAADYFDKQTTTSASPVLLRAALIPDETSTELSIEGHAWWSDQRRRLLAHVSVHRHAGNLISPADDIPTFSDLPNGVTSGSWAWTITVNNTSKAVEVSFTGDGSHIVGTTVEINAKHTADA